MTSILIDNRRMLQYGTDVKASASELEPFYKDLPAGVDPTAESSTLGAHLVRVIYEQAATLQ
jgi:hypothetical protein